MHPIIKWPGGKTRLLPELIARMPARFNRYYEPFLGGAALFLHVRPENAILSDLNADLINVYRELANHSDDVVRKLELYASSHSKAYYYSMRTAWNLPDAWGVDVSGRAALFIYLNKTCFNGLWRVNAAGEFNVPMGDYENPKILDAEALLQAGKVFTKATLTVSDFKFSVQSAGSGDFVYFDPPYIPTSPSSGFTAYNPGGFGKAHHEDLATLARMLVKRGSFVMLSNSDTPLAHDLYKGFKIDKVSRAGTINSDKTKRGRVGELIITGGYDYSTQKLTPTRPKKGCLSDV